ncbi:MAG TPA: hypothetical protein VHF22_13840, partial [Planctomycetota bacterium]|nr:hypothetical protein [Planctomycetota bacterium]
MRRLAFQAGVLMSVLALSQAAARGQAQETDLAEDFALAQDRGKVLDQLIPGTEEHYYYSCLHLENQGKLDDAEAVLAQWVKRYGYTARVEEMRNRQALLRYAKDPKATLAFLRDRLNVRLDHEREVMGQKSAYPTRLDPAAIGREALARRALESYRDTSGFEAAALEALAADGGLDADRRRSLLQRLERPDIPGLAKLVVDDLRAPRSGGFGSMRIHRELTLAQLDECLKLLPGLRNETNFVRAYLAKLAPGPDQDWRSDPAVREAWLERLWAFASTLAPAHNSLKAHVLYHRLAHDRALGVYDRARFLAYLAIPRSVRYMNPDYLRRESRVAPAYLGQSFQDVTGLAPVADDEALVRDFIAHFVLENDGDASAFAPFVADAWLKDLLAETMLLAGKGDMERWYSLLGDPAKVQALKDRVDIEFAPTARAYWGAEEPVALDVDVKNVKTLIVKVFEIDTASYFREKKKEIDLAVNLDGLVANEEKTYTYDEPPLRRVRRRFEFPSLARRGAFVVELIGNGRSSRALVRKGGLRFVERPGSAGHVFTIFDEANRKVEKAKIWLGEHEHAADPDGTIVVPYSTNPGMTPIVIEQGGFAVLERFMRQAERYELRAGFYVDREALLKGAKAKVAMRPELTVDGAPVALSLLEEPTLVIQSTDRDGTPSSKELHGLTLTAEREWVTEVQVPENLAALEFTLKGKVQSLSKNQKEDVADRASFALNRIDQGDKTEDLHLARSAAGYAIRLLGKNGEAKPDRPISLTFKHRLFVQTVDALLQTDAEGRVDLGALEDIAWVRASDPEGTQHTWTLGHDRHSYPREVHGRAGEAIAVPYMGGAREVTPASFSLLELRNGTFVADWSSSLALADGYVEARGLPAGSYSLAIKGPTGREVRLEVGAGELREGRLLGTTRILEPRARPPVQIASVEAGGAEVKVRLANATKATRVHVVATRFRPAYSMYDRLGGPAPEPEAVRVGKDESFYVSGRDIGDEYRYILERRYAKKFPGNMLARPSLLLNPWALRDTDAGIENVGEGGAYAGRMGGRGPRGGRYGGAAHAEPESDDAAFANLDFLGQPAAVFLNLEPATDGTVTIARKDLGDAQEVQVLAVNPQETAFRAVPLPESPLARRDLRLMDALDPSKHESEQKEVSFVAADAPFVVNDLTTSKVELYDTLRRVYALFGTLSHDPTLAEFGFVMEWPRLSPAEKREKYSRYACHELSFFLSRKDPEFFAEVVKPYLANKKDKTFMDHYLLGEELRGYLAPWEYSRLNVVERILLSGRIPGEPQATARHVKDLFDLLPPDVEARNRLFMTAIAGSALESGDELGMGAARDKAAKQKEEMRRAQEISGGAPGGTDRSGFGYNGPAEAPAA